MFRMTGVTVFSKAIQDGINSGEFSSSNDPCSSRSNYI